MAACLEVETRRLSAEILGDRLRSLFCSYKLGTTHASEASLVFLNPRATLGPLVHDVLLDIRRDRLVGAELHRERALATGHTLQVGGVAQDFTSGTLAWIDCTPPGNASIPVIWPRLVARSAVMSPNLLSGTTTSKVTIGSSNTGRAS